MHGTSAFGVPRDWRNRESRSGEPRAGGLPNDEQESFFGRQLDFLSYCPFGRVFEGPQRRRPVGWVLPLNVRSAPGSNRLD